MLRREIVCREVYQRLEDLDIIVEEKNHICWPSFRLRKIDVPRKPGPSQPTKWTIYKLAAKQMRLDVIKAPTRLPQ
jgi:hypothetical protein